MNSNYNPYGQQNGYGQQYDPYSQQNGYSQQPVQPQYDPYSQQQYGYSQQPAQSQYDPYSQQQYGGYSSQQASPYQSGYGVSPYQSQYPAAAPINLYTQQQYVVSPYGAQDNTKKKQPLGALAVFGLIFGILAMVLCGVGAVLTIFGTVFSVLSAAFSIFGMIFSGIAKAKGNTGGAAKAGMTLSIIALILSLIAVVSCGSLLACAAGVSGAGSAYDYCFVLSPTGWIF